MDNSTFASNNCVEGAHNAGLRPQLLENIKPELLELVARHLAQMAQASEVRMALHSLRNDIATPLSGQQESVRA
jgi:hypothetical protein